MLILGFSRGNYILVTQNTQLEVLYYLKFLTFFKALVLELMPHDYKQAQDAPYILKENLFSILPFLALSWNFHIVIRTIL
jgi:hypothetical protein